MASGTPHLSLVPSLARQPIQGLIARARAWPVASQQQARRNAMVASTACAERRAEREDVATFLADDAARHAERDRVARTAVAHA